MVAEVGDCSCTCSNTLRRPSEATCWFRFGASPSLLLQVSRPRSAAYPLYVSRVLSTRGIRQTIPLYPGGLSKQIARISYRKRVEDTRPRQLVSFPSPNSLTGVRSRPEAKHTHTHTHTLYYPPVSCSTCLLDTNKLTASRSPLVVGQVGTCRRACPTARTASRS